MAVFSCLGDTLQHRWLKQKAIRDLKTYLTLSRAKSSPLDKVMHVETSLPMSLASAHRETRAVTASAGRSL